MHLKYSVELAEAVSYQAEFIHQSLPAGKFYFGTALLSLAIASTYSYFNYPEAIVNGHPSSTGRLVTALLFQIPLLSSIIYFILFFMKRSFAQSVGAVLVKNQPAEHWGEREFTIADGKISIITPVKTTQFPVTQVTSVKETHTAYFLLNRKNTLATVPKKLCSRRELDLALSSSTPPVV